MLNKDIRTNHMIPCQPYIEKYEFKIITLLDKKDYKRITFDKLDNKKNN